MAGDEGAAANPAELLPAALAGHVIATLVLFDHGSTVRTALDENALFAEPFFKLALGQLLVLLCLSAADFGVEIPMATEADLRVAVLAGERGAVSGRLQLHSTTTIGIGAPDDVGVGAQEGDQGVAHEAVVVLRHQLLDGFGRRLFFATQERTAQSFGIVVFNLLLQVADQTRMAVAMGGRVAHTNGTGQGQGSVVETNGTCHSFSSPLLQLGQKLVARNRSDRSEDRRLFIAQAGVALGNGQGKPCLAKLAASVGALAACPVCAGSTVPAF